MKTCIYCKCEVNGDSVIDFCEMCGKGAFGEKMFDVILKNMKDARKRGDLEQGRFL